MLIPNYRYKIRPRLDFLLYDGLEYSDWSFYFFPANRSATNKRSKIYAGNFLYMIGRR